jgi:hypothetical protein
MIATGCGTTNVSRTLPKSDSSKQGQCDAAISAVTEHVEALTRDFALLYQLVDAQLYLYRGKTL